MNKIISVLMLGMCLLTSGCISGLLRFSGWHDYYHHYKLVKVPGTNEWYSVRDFHVYHGTSEILYSLDAPFRLFTDYPKGPEGSLDNAIMTLLWPIELIDLPFELVFDTVFLPVDIYYHIDASRENKKIRKRYDN